MKNVFKKVNVLDYIKKNKIDFKKFKNIEKLVIIKEIESDKENRRLFLCKNQAGREVVRSDFMLEYDYNKLASGAYVKKERKVVLAFQVKENIQFSSSFGGICKLFKGDYIIMNDKIIDGIKKEDFEENYKSVYKANKLAKAYNEEIIRVM